MEQRHEYRSSRKATTMPRALFLLPSIVLFGIQVHAETSHQKNVAADAGGGARRRRRIIARSGGDGGYHSPPAGLRSLNREEEEEEEDDDDAPTSSSSSSSSSSGRSARNNNNRVDFLYTYGSPSVVAGPHVSNPGNRCGELCSSASRNGGALLPTIFSRLRIFRAIFSPLHFSVGMLPPPSPRTTKLAVPGIRAYTEDVSSGRRDCEWWQAVWCDEYDRITNTDFASQINVDKYPHPKMSTLVLRYRDDSVVEYIHEECDDTDEVGRYDYQSWPGTDVPSGTIPGFNVHGLGDHYERRLAEVPPRTRGPLLEYIPVSMCGSETSRGELVACLDRHGLAPGWEPLAHMTHVTDFGWIGVDKDVVL